MNFYKKASSNRRHQRGQFVGVAHLHDLPSILGHDLENKAHLLVAQVATAQVLFSKAGSKHSVNTAEANAVVVARGLGHLLVGGLVLLIDANQCLERPNLVAREHLLDVGDRVLLGGFHAANYDFFFIKVEQKIKQITKSSFSIHTPRSETMSRFYCKFLSFASYNRNRAHLHENCSIDLLHNFQPIDA